MDVPREATRRRRPYVLALAGALALALVTVVLSRLADAPPSIDKSAVWIDTVRRGAFLRQVSGPGALVPEEIRWVTASSAGRVEQIHAAPGSATEPDTVLLELTNADLQLKALEAGREYKSAEAEFVNLRAMLEMDRLEQKSRVAAVRVDYHEARRRAAAADELHAKDIMGELEHVQIRERAQELRGRLAIEREQAEMLVQGAAARIEAQGSKVERLEALAAFRAGQIEALQVRAGRAGVLEDLPLEVGQSVKPGDLLAKVVDPSRLKAELRIPEARAKEVQLGLPAEIQAPGGSVPGRVVRIDPSVERGTVTVDVALQGELPPGARPDLSIEGRIELERMDDVLYTGRPAVGSANGLVTLFKLTDGGASAVRVPVSLGGSSVSEVQIVEGLVEGDRVVLSDMSRWDAVDEIDLH